MSRLVVLVALAFWTGPARAAPLVVDLSQHLVAITTGFAGAEVLLFGAVEQPGDVVVVVRGPGRPITMYRKTEIGGIWINTARMTFKRDDKRADPPSFYAIASSRPLEEIASPNVLMRNGMILEELDELQLPSAKASPNVALEWRDALIRNQQRQGLYQAEIGRVGFLGDSLFRTRLVLPANVPTGVYQVVVSLLVDGQEVSAQTTPLVVSKVGAEAEIFDFAHQQSAWYGVIAILVALMAGWLAHVAFRRA
jgi:uncharacterized protein (TIGR02186 family)